MKVAAKFQVRLKRLKFILINAILINLNLLKLRNLYK